MIGLELSGLCQFLSDLGDYLPEGCGVVGHQVVLRCSGERAFEARNTCLDGGEFLPFDAKLPSAHAEVVADAGEQLLGIAEEVDDLRPDLLFDPACIDSVGSAPWR